MRRVLSLDESLENEEHLDVVVREFRLPLRMVNMISGCVAFLSGCAMRRMFRGVELIAPEKDSIIAPPSTPPGNDLNIDAESGSSWIDYIGPLTSEEIDSDKRWSYRDPNGNIHGLFSLAQAIFRFGVRFAHERNNELPRKLTNDPRCTRRGADEESLDHSTQMPILVYDLEQARYSSSQFIFLDTPYVIGFMNQFEYKSPRTMSQLMFAITFWWLWIWDKNSKRYLGVMGNTNRFMSVSAYVIEKMSDALCFKRRYAEAKGEYGNAVGMWNFAEMTEDASFVPLLKTMENVRLRDQSYLLLCEELLWQETWA
ncbi:hypothetical protein Tco_0051943 [Tanacetum coccineum]